MSSRGIMIHTCMWVTYLLCLAYGANAFSFQTHYRQELIRDLFTNYSLHVHPQDNSEHVVGVDVMFHLRNIMGLEETSEILTSNGWMDISWYDLRLRWNTTLYGSVNDFYISRKAIWIPDITIDNTANQYKVVGHPDDIVKISSVGLVSWYPGDVYRTGCSLDITYFPFDNQNCRVKIALWSYAHDVVRIVSAKTAPSVSEKHGEWEVKGVSVTVREVPVDNVTEATVYIKMHRRSTFYVLNIILPLIMTTFLNAFVFILPTESGEKITLATALFLSLAVFLSYVTDKMPRTSTNVYILGLFVSTQLVFSALSILCTVIVLKLQHRDGKLKEHQKKENSLGSKLDMIFFVVFFVFGLGASGGLLIMLQVT